MESIHNWLVNVQILASLHSLLMYFIQISAWCFDKMYLGHEAGLLFIVAVATDLVKTQIGVSTIHHAD